MRTWLLGVVAAAAVGSVRADEPSVALSVEDGPREGMVTYRLTLDRDAAERLRDAVADSDPKRTAQVLSSLTTNPAHKLVAGLAASNADAFRRRLTDPKAIGPKGIEITFSARTSSPETTSADGRRNGPVRAWVRRAGKQAAEVVLNPWSWDTKPRE